MQERVFLGIFPNKFRLDARTQCVPIFYIFLFLKAIGTIHFFSFRDAIVYATSTFTEGLPTVMNILSDGIFRQNIDDDLVRYSTYSTELSYNVKK